MRAFLALLALLIVGLKLMGRRWWCACGSWNPFSWDINSSHNSQHLFDPYSFTHILHGVLLYGLFHRLPAAWRLPLALGVESVWELIENSPPVIERFRQSAISLNYIGDSIVNSAGDLISCTVGFLLAGWLPVWASVALFLGTEAVLYVTIKDGLILAAASLFFPRSQ